MLENDMITLEESKKIRLSKNFTLYEFMYSYTAIRLGINNDMPRKFLPRIQFLVDTVLQPLRDRFGPLHINSGYRSVALCLAVGSSEHSNHAYGFAADITPKAEGVTLMDLLEFINSNLDYKELIAEKFSTFGNNGWVHVAAEDGNNKKELKLYDDTHYYTKVNIGYIQSLYSVAA